MTLSAPTLPPPCAEVLPTSFDILVRDRDTAWEACADPQRALSLLPRFLGLSLLALSAHAAVMAVVWGLDPHASTASHTPLEFGLRVMGVFTGSLLGANMAALPTFYLHTLLAGVRTHGWRVSVEVMRIQATEATVLLGLLPILAVVGVGTALMGTHDGVKVCLALGFALPFLAGLPALSGLVRTFSRLAAEAPPPPQGTRGGMPTLLVLAWSLLFALMAPLGAAGLWGLTGS